MNEPIHIISLGAGVQSSTMALMAAAGEITPMPKCAIFADTKSEPKSVYVWLDWLENWLPFPVHRVTKGNLFELATAVRTSKTGTKYTKHTPPAFIRDGEKHGILMRQCTEDVKINVIYRELNRIRQKRPVIQWIGISIDEAARMKPARRKWVENRWPLIESNITRSDCFAWMQKRSFPKPPRSACVFCPYHDDREWLRLRDEEPQEFDRAAEFEKALQLAMSQVTGFRGKPFLHRSHVLISEVKFMPTEPKRQFQTNLNFVNECEGMCGV